MHHKRLEITSEPIETLKTDAQNIRVHDDKNYQAVMDSLKAHGLRKPIVAHAKTRIVYAGNLTLACAKALGYTEIDVAWIPSEVSEADCRRFALRDNRTNDLSFFDEPKLREFLESQPVDSYESLGFTQRDFDALLPAIDKVLTSPEDFPSYDETLETTHECPKCKYRW